MTLRDTAIERATAVVRSGQFDPGTSYTRAGIAAGVDAALATIREQLRTLPSAVVMDSSDDRAVWRYHVEELLAEREGDQPAPVPDPPTHSVPGKMSGAECFTGTRITVEMIRSLVTDQGVPVAEVCHWYPGLTPEWIGAALAEREGDQ